MTSEIFKTKTESLETPEIVIESFNEMESVVELEWTEVRCATAYKIYQSIDGIQDFPGKETKELKLTFDRPIIRCSSYVYSISSIFEGKELSDLQEGNVVIPPNIQAQPEWEVIVVEKIVTVIFKIPNENVKCEIGGFEISHNASGIDSPLQFDPNEKIVLNFTETQFNDRVKLSGRIFSVSYTHLTLPTKA